MKHFLFSALLGLLVLNAVILGALWGQIPPHPPNWVGPYLGALIALAAASLPLVWRGAKTGFVGAIVSAAMSLLSVGPQKFFIEENALVLSPVIILGTAFIIVIFFCAVKEWK